MKALSIKHPWAWLIIRPDVTDPEQRASLYEKGLIKDIENRDWPTRFRGTFLVHAGKTFDMDGYRWVKEEFPEIQLPEPHEFQLGGIVGQATLTHCIDDSDSDWFFGTYGFVLKDAKLLDFVPLRGQLSFFEVELTEATSDQ